MILFVRFFPDQQYVCLSQTGRIRQNLLPKEFKSTFNLLECRNCMASLVFLHITLKPYRYDRNNLHDAVVTESDATSSAEEVIIYLEPAN